MTGDAAERAREDILAELTGPGGPFALTSTTVRGIPMRVYADAPRSLRDVLEASRAYGDRDVLVFDDPATGRTERTTFAEHHTLVARLAHHLRDARGLVAGDRLAITMRNYPDWSPWFWAAQALGVLVVPLNAWWTGPELAYALHDCTPRLVVADPERARILAGHRSELPDLDVLEVRGDAPPTGVEAWDPAVLPGATELPDAEVGPDDDATILYTSGTTGRPKGAVGTHRNLCTDLTNRALGLAVGARTTGTVPPPHPGVLLTFPLFHVAGVSALCTAVAAGTTVVTQYRWDADLARRQVAREGLTSAAGVPTVMADLVAAAAEHPEDLATMSGIGMGGAPIPADLVRRVGTLARPVVPSAGYGLTETTAAIVSAAGADYAENPDGAGRPVPGADVRIVDPGTLDEVPDGEVGELWFRGPNVVRGYWNAPEATAAAFVDGWFRTGDLGRWRGGRLQVVDRLKDVVIRGGENVYCAEVENALVEHPDVLDAAVVGLPHPTLGEEVAAVVVVGAGCGLDEDGVRAHAAARLAGFMVPAHVRVRTGPLPRNATGKVLKRELREGF